MRRGFVHLDRLNRWLALAAGAVLVALAVLTVVDVLMRYLFGLPIEGMVDIAELSLVVVVFFAAAYCGRTGGHVSVDLFTDALGPRARRWTDVLIKLTAAPVFLLLAWRSWISGLDATEFGEASNLLFIPHQPFFIVISLGAMLYALVLMLEGAALILDQRGAPPAGRT